MSSNAAAGVAEKVGEHEEGLERGPARAASAPRMNGALFLMLIVAVQAAWLALLLYGSWLVLF